jgi:DNA anti-recombination protein RmuC
MYLRTILIVLMLGALTLFTAANWHAFITPTTLSLIFATVEAPLGLVLLGGLVLLAALFLIYVVYLQSSVLFETRRHARDLNAQRELAEHAEISRIHELQSFLETQLQTLARQTEQSKSQLAERLDQLERDLRQSVEQCQNSLAAQLAEIDDRFDRGEN